MTYALPKNIFGVDSSYFFGRWVYVERLDVDVARIRVRFNSDCETSGPFTFRIRYVDNAGDLPSRIRELPGFSARSPYVHSIPDKFRNRPFRLTLTLDDSLAYLNDFDPTVGSVQLIE